jgi:hypothetical protein
MPSPELSFGTVNVENVDRLRMTIYKDDVPWDLTLGSVELTFSRKGVTETFTRTAVAEDAAEGIFYYDTTVTDLTEAGMWLIRVTATDGDIVKTYPYEISLRVVER